MMRQSWEMRMMMMVIDVIFHGFHPLLGVRAVHRFLEALGRRDRPILRDGEDTRVSATRDEVGEIRSILRARGVASVCLMGADVGLHTSSLCRSGLLLSLSRHYALVSSQLGGVRPVVLIELDRHCRGVALDLNHVHVVAAPIVIISEVDSEHSARVSL